MPKSWSDTPGTIYLHVTSVPTDGTSQLAGLEPRVLKAAIHGGEALPYTQEGGHLEIAIPSNKHDPFCTVIELTLDLLITEIIATNVRAK